MEPVCQYYVETSGWIYVHNDGSPTQRRQVLYSQPHRKRPLLFTDVHRCVWLPPPFNAENSAYTGVMLVKFGRKFSPSMEPSKDIRVPVAAQDTTFPLLAPFPHRLQSPASHWRIFAPFTQGPGVLFTFFNAHFFILEPGLIF